MYPNLNIAEKTPYNHLVIEFLNDFLNLTLYMSSIG